MPRRRPCGAPEARAPERSGLDGPEGAGKHKVTAELAADGAGILTVDGKKTGGGKLPDLIARQPAEGGDGRGAVGDYAAPNIFKEMVENTTVESR